MPCKRSVFHVMALNKMASVYRFMKEKRFQTWLYALLSTCTAFNLCHVTLSIRLSQRRHSLQIKDHLLKVKRGSELLSLVFHIFTLHGSVYTIHHKIFLKYYIALKQKLASLFHIHIVFYPWHLYCSPSCFFIILFGPRLPTGPLGLAKAGLCRFFFGWISSSK